MLHQSKAVVLS